MSDILSYIQNNPQETQRLVGIKYDQLEQLIKQAIALDIEKQQNIEKNKVRIINKGGGRKVKLSNRHLRKILIPFYDWLSTGDRQLQISATLNAKIRL